MSKTKDANSFAGTPATNRSGSWGNKRSNSPPPSPSNASMAPPADLCLEFLGKEVEGRQLLTMHDVNVSIDGLRTLTKHGCWREACKLSEHCISHTTLKPHEFLQWKHVYVLCLVKLQLYDQAQHEVDQLGDFDSDKHLFQQYPNYYHTKTGCMVPWSLRFLNAKLPRMRAESKTGAPQEQFLRDALKRLYALLHTCVESAEALDKKKQKSVAAPASLMTSDPLATPGADADCEEPETVDLWVKRRVTVVLELATVHVAMNQIQCGIKLLGHTLEYFTPKLRDTIPTRQLQYMDLNSKLASLHMQVGQLVQAEAVFKNIEQIDPRTLTHEGQHQHKSTSAMNRGLLHLANGAYKDAIDSFNTVLAQGFNALAVTNRSICLLYTCNLTEAITTIEDLIRENPAAALEEPVVYNLCTLYDLQVENSVAAHKKRVVQALAHKFIGDHFPPKALKLDK
eukprot:TRINITY_DN62788_c0_g1_i1.p1 TRINITY_DN62788_c0_g1~~TRINITY_DN62788_c0_g1_i1.p1  ORF type:complete len:454 (-),score=13.43 TRINITY_DN62788_c0_g1_i1:497-1858(-)